MKPENQEKTTDMPRVTGILYPILFSPRQSGIRIHVDRYYDGTINSLKNRIRKYYDLASIAGSIVLSLLYLKNIDNLLVKLVVTLAILISTFILHSIVCYYCMFN